MHYSPDMTDGDYEEILEKAKRELLNEQNALGECLKKQEAHEKRIADLRATVAALSRMLDREFVEEDAIGLTDAIRAAFKSVGLGTLVPTEVKDRLKMMGYNTVKYGNLMASVHTIITRLVLRGEIRQAGTRDGKPAYTLATPKSKLRMEPSPK